MKTIGISSFGPINKAKIDFGDLTLFVGPQASGKSILLQLIKLLIDKNQIETTLNQYGFVWGDNTEDNLTRFFGEGMSGVWNSETAINFDGNPYFLNSLAPKKKELLSLDKGYIDLFYIPAQRVVCLNYGWPRFFTDFEDSVPYVLRDFSETLRQYLEVGITQEGSVFPQVGHIDEPINNSFNESIFHGSQVIIDKTTKKRLKLVIGNTSLPFMTWSAGQKEFMPLLLGFYWLCSSKTGKRKGTNYVIIEEPEMGLHPQAIKSVILQILDLLSRGYQVIVSTHSPVFLEFAWAFNILKQSNAGGKAIAELFESDFSTFDMSNLDKLLKEKNINTYYFDNSNDSVNIKDISTLDAGNLDPAVSEWGGLSSFSAKATDIVSSLTSKDA